MKKEKNIMFSYSTIRRYLTDSQLTELKGFIHDSGISIYSSQRYPSGKPKPIHLQTVISQILKQKADIEIPDVVVILKQIDNGSAAALPKYKIQRPRKKPSTPPRSDNGVPSRLKVRREEIEPLKDHLNVYYEIIKKSESPEYAKQYLQELKDYILRHRDFNSDIS